MERINASKQYLFQTSRSSNAQVKSYEVETKTHYSRMVIDQSIN